MENINESFKGLIKNNIEMVKKRGETATFYFPEGGINQEEAM